MCSQSFRAIPNKKNVQMNKNIHKIYIHNKFKKKKTIKYIAYQQIVILWYRPFVWALTMAPVFEQILK